jgi:hypothetical protein
MKQVIATSVFAATLLMIMPSIPVIQGAIAEGANAIQCIGQDQTIRKNEQKEILGNKLQDLKEKCLVALLVCTLSIYLMTYAIGGSIGSVIDRTLFLVTKGKWELHRATKITLMPSEIIFSIMVNLYSIGMTKYGWSPNFPPGYHERFRSTETQEKKDARNYFSKMFLIIQSGSKGI